MVISFVKDLAFRAGKLCLAERRTLGSEDLFFKNPKDLVTVADRRVEEFIVGEIRQHYPGHAIFGEETGQRPGSDNARWIIDPIDGTTSFVHNQPFYSVSIALEQQGRLTAAAVCAPALDQLFYAGLGQGAFLNGDPIRTSATRELDKAVMATGFACLRAGKAANNLTHFNQIVPRLRDIRRYGSAAVDLCYVACGRLDGFWEMHLNLYDIAAGVLIVQEAGGRVTDFHGGHHFPEQGIATANPALLPRLTDLLKDGPDGQE